MEERQLHFCGGGQLHFSEGETDTFLWWGDSYTSVVEGRTVALGVDHYISVVGRQLHFCGWETATFQWWGDSYISVVGR